MNEIIELQLFPSSCNHCSEIVSEEYVYCTYCGFPHNGTVKDLALYEKRIRDKDRTNEEAKRKIKNARNTLYVMSAITFLFGLFSFSGELGSALFTISTIQSIIYLVLAYWSTQKPLISLLLGLFLYLTIIIVSAVSDPGTIVRGIIFKVIIIAFLAKGIYSASSIKKISYAY
ncbi:hypothetical protein RM697_05720 [Ichthyenterobacterium sp. W332]|uniref:Zinc ribbon domain-containing protein n=1 Tax=Microcosmobacter mediterraneus TaxID=3075607 RepID=A0ABU2YM39_9FLAO|nr:hypothetical protein [Ichthyenterobacterium sp. W332]MDT0558133.1 hypothetical protein [Ichthyenterobacterium sp. W332]